MNKQLTIGIVLGATALAGLFFFSTRDTDIRASLETGNAAIEITNSNQNLATTTSIGITSSSTITEDYISDEDDEPNEPVVSDDAWKTSAYTEPLPPEPSGNEAKYGFPDTNNNKVRDDIELLIVQEYGESEMMVEALFAQARNKEYDLKIALDGFIAQEEIVERNELASKDTACRFLYYTNTLGTVEEYFDEKTYQTVSQNYHNSDSRVESHSAVQKALHGSVSGGLELTHDQCQEYFQETRNLDIGG